MHTLRKLTNAVQYATRASSKRAAVNMACEMLAEADSIEEIEEIEEVAYGAARGSNDRKALLWAAVGAAKDRLSAEEE